MRRLGFNFTVASVAIPCLIFIGCGRKKADHNDAAEVSPTVTDDDPDTQLVGAVKQRWVEKTAHLLRAPSAPALSLDDTTRLEAMPAAQVVDEMVAAPGFDNMVVDFGMYMLGLKSDNIVYPDPNDALSSDHSILEIPQIFLGPSLLEKGGEFLAIFDENAPMLAEPLGAAVDFETFKTFPGKPKRADAYAKTGAWAAKMETLLNASTPPDRAAYCAAVLDFEDLIFSIPGVPFEYIEGLRGTDFSALFQPCYGRTGAGTGSGSGSEPPFQFPDRAKDHVDKIKGKSTEVFAYFDELESDVYHPRDVASVKPLDLNRLGLDKGRVFGASSFRWFWQKLPNSSTNQDRKRANYVLKRFFCDDLTPLNVVTPEDHAGQNKHASDPSCQSCHYKLDPMAGFFRTRGGSGYDAKNDKSIDFDDQATKPLAEYLKAWKRDGDPAHPWNVGYVRSSTDDALTDWGDHPGDPALQDLFGVIRRAPEAKRCLVRRLFQYVVGENQAIDAGWLDGLTQSYIDQASGDAFKQTVKALVLSKTFRTPDPESEQCYDFAPGETGEGKPPCKVAHLIEKNCASCHTGLGAQGGLDLMTWTAREDGQSGFAQIEPDGAQVARLDTLQRISDRLTSGDASLRMPLNKAMDEGERVVLYQWIADLLSEKEP